MQAKICFLLLAALCLIALTKAQIGGGAGLINALKNLKKQTDDLQNDMAKYQSTVEPSLRRTLDNLQLVSNIQISSTTNRVLRDIHISAIKRKLEGKDASLCVKEAQNNANNILSSGKSELSACRTKYLSAIDPTIKDMDNYILKCKLFKVDLDRIASDCLSPDPMATDRCIAWQLIGANVTYKILQRESATLKENASYVSESSTKNGKSCMNAAVAAASQSTSTLKSNADQCIKNV
ncbi:hypothetical protein KM043_017512 [Ampulex compressa]|nr:hypothetical protein KM043_017512 [Ampulex compressa]